MTTREQRVAAVVVAWENLDRSSKGDLLLTQPELYFACARLAADAVVKGERR